MAFDTSSLDLKVREWGRLVMDIALDRFIETKKGLAPIGETGDLHDSIEARGVDDTGDGYTAEVVVDVEYASYTDEGTEAHDIHGNPFLAFQIDGEDIVVPLVHWVPGPGVAANKGWWSNSIDDQWSAAIETAAGEVTV